MKNRIIAESISLPAIPDEVLNRYPGVVEAIAKLEEEGFPILSYDASLGGNYPVICVVLFNPTNGTCFASFGAHPDFGVALERTVTELLQGRSLKDLDVFTAPTFDDEEVAEHTNLETHFIDSSGLISWDLFKQDADYPFVDWNFSGSTQEEFATLMSIFDKEDAEVYIADYEHLGVYACRIIVPGMSDIYPSEDLLLANNSMGAHLRDTLLALPGSEWEPEEYLALIEQLDDEGLDDFTRVRELLGIASGVVPPDELDVGAVLLVVVLDAELEALHEDGHSWDVDTTKGGNLAGLGAGGGGVTGQKRSLIGLEGQTQNVGQFGGGTTGFAFFGTGEAIGIGVVHDSELLIRVGFGSRRGIYTEQKTDGDDQIGAFIEQLLDVLLVVRLLLGFQVFTFHTQVSYGFLDAFIGRGIERLVVNTAQVCYLGNLESVTTGAAARRKGKCSNNEQGYHRVQLFHVFFSSILCVFAGMLFATPYDFASIKRNLSLCKPP